MNIMFIFPVNLHKRSWLDMLNPLARHKSPPSNEFEVPLAGDSSNYIGNNSHN